MALAPNIRAGWTVTVEDDETVHVLPVDDLLSHERIDCVCGPDVEACPRPDGSLGWLYTHHSLDGREAYE